MVYPYLLNCIVPVMSLKSPVKLTEDKSFTSQLKICLRNLKERKKKNASVANLVFSHLHKKTFVVRMECLFSAMGTLLFGALLFSN